MSTEYISTNSGFLTVDSVKSGDRVLIMEDAYSQFSEKAQKTYWNCKVELSDGTTKLTSLMDSVCDQLVKRWGKMTGDWTGHYLEVEIRTAKSSGNPYIWLTPVDGEKVNLDLKRKEKADKEAANLPPQEKPIEYLEAEISPEDIPF